MSGTFLVLHDRGPRSGEVQDEATLAKRDVASFPAADERYFDAMDNGEKLSDDAVKGRNMWLVWTGGNDRFWDTVIKDSFGTFDLLKMISSAPGLPYSRDNRWEYFGVVNEPCFDKASGPDPSRFGLWLDRRRADCPADPFADEKKYPGVKIGARGSDGLPVGSYYGEPTGIVGLRLFPNPDFDAEARRRWDPERYYKDKTYYQQKDLVRPYRVGMACAFCHIGPSPINPPRDPERPELGESERHGRLAVFLVRPRLRLEQRPVEFHLPAPPRLSAGLAGYVAGVIRQHRQSADHERDLRPRTASQAGQAARPANC